MKMVETCQNWKVYTLIYWGLLKLKSHCSKVVISRGGTAKYVPGHGVSQVLMTGHSSWVRNLQKRTSQLIRRSKYVIPSPQEGIPPRRKPANMYWICSWLGVPYWGLGLCGGLKPWWTTAGRPKSAHIWQLMFFHSSTSERFHLWLGGCSIIGRHNSKSTPWKTPRTAPQLPAASGFACWTLNLPVEKCLPPNVANYHRSWGKMPWPI